MGLHLHNGGTVAVLNARTLAPLIAMGATWGARKGMSTAYAKRTGHAPPTADDPEVSLTRALGWALATAVVSVAIEVVITRVAAQYTDSHELTNTDDSNLSVTAFSSD